MRRTKISDTSVRRPCGRVDGRPRPRMSDSDSFQQRKIQEFFIAMYLVLGKWCGFFVHKWRSLNSQKKILWIFCPQMTLTQFPICGFFVHNFQIGVNNLGRNILMKSVCSRKVSLKIIGQLIPLSNGDSTKLIKFQVRKRKTLWLVRQLVLRWSSLACKAQLIGRERL